MRIPAAAIHLAEGSPERAIELLAPVAERSVESLIPTWAAIHALLFDAAAREEIGDRRDAEAALERALDLAEPEGLILPFTIIPVEGLLERYPRHRTAHATFLSTILDVRRTRSGRTCATSTPSSPSTVAPRQSPAPESSGSSHHPTGAALALYGRSSCTGASLRDAPVASLQSRKVSDDRSHPAVSS